MINFGRHTLTSKWRLNQSAQPITIFNYLGLKFMIYLVNSLYAVGLKIKHFKHFTGVVLRIFCDQDRFFSFFFCFLRLYPRHMEIPRLGVESESQLLAYATATAMQDLSLICDLYCSSWQSWILNPLSEARDQTRLLMNPSRVC